VTPRSGGIVLRTRASATWHPSLCQQPPGLAVTIPIPGAVRLIVADTLQPDDGTQEQRREIIEHCLWRTPAEAADSLVGRVGARRLCTGAAVVDLQPGGRAEVHVRDAPPAVLLRPDEPPRHLPDPSSGLGSCLAMWPGDVLLVCSPALLDDPADLLRTIRRSRRHASADLERVLSGLTAAARRGAAAAVQSTVANSARGDGRKRRQSFPLPSSR
jgi:hypothetical protein